MKLNIRNILLLVVVVLIAKTCGDGPRTTGKGSHVGETSTLARSSIQPYVPTEPVAPQTKTRYVGPKSLNVRASPDGAVTGSLPHGAAVEIHREQNGWGRISSEGLPEKWVATDYLCKQKDCGDTPKWQSSAPPAPVPPRPIARPSTSYGSCPCSSGRNCYGPRGGRYCITSGGNKRYR